MKIAILEENHFEVLDVYVKIFQSAFGEKSVFVITNTNILQLLEQQIEEEHLLITDNISRNKSLSDLIFNFLQTQKIDILLYNTIEIGEYAFADALVKKVISNLSTKVVLTLHNINSFVKPSLFIAKHPKSFLKNIISIYRKKRLLKSVSALNVLCENQASYLKNIIGYPNTVLYVPPCIANSNHEKSVSSEPSGSKKLVTITILGGVDKNRKDFPTILNAFKLLGDTCKFFHLQIIGATKGEYAIEVKNSLLQLARSCSLVFSFPEEGQPILSNKQVSEILTKTDFLLCPTVPVALYEGNKEYYGLSKSTGNFYDIIRYSKPAIFPEAIPIPDSLKKSVLTYSDSASLAGLLRSLQANLSLKNDLDKAVISAQESYALLKVAKSVQEQFSTIIISS